MLTRATTRQLFPTLALVILALAGTTAVAEDDRPPNVVLIFTDDKYYSPVSSCPLHQILLGFQAFSISAVSREFRAISWDPRPLTTVCYSGLPVQALR